VNGACTLCQDNHPQSDVQDDGCYDGSPLCDAGVGTGTGECFKCQTVGFNGPGTYDLGCSIFAPICDSYGSFGQSCGICSRFKDDQGNFIGCPKDTLCKGGTSNVGYVCEPLPCGEGPACVASQFCVDGKCLNCRDSDPAGGRDDGCDGANLICDESVGECFKCQPSIGNSKADFGCIESEPFCDSGTNCGLCLHIQDEITGNDIGCPKDTVCTGGLGKVGYDCDQLPPPPQPPATPPSAPAPTKCTGHHCKYRSSRRLLTTSYPLSREDDGYDRYLSDCGGFEYNVSLYVDESTHLYAVGFPNEDAAAAGCPMIATHAIVQLHGAPATKELLVWDDIEQGRNMFDSDGFVSVGTFQVADLARAFDNVKLGSKGGYDIVTNNCATYLVNLASELGVKVDTRITGFVARRLLENSGSEFVKSVRASVSYLTLFQGRNLCSAEAATDEDIVELVVNAGASKLIV
jgi:hypothetical protein